MVDCGGQTKTLKSRKGSCSSVDGSHSRLKLTFYRWVKQRISRLEWCKLFLDFIHINLCQIEIIGLNIWRIFSVRCPGSSQNLGLDQEAKASQATVPVAIGKKIGGPMTYHPD